MAEQFAGLTLGVDVDQLNKAVKSLKDFRQANNEAKASVESFVDQNQVAKTQARELAAELAKQRKEFKSIQQAIDPTAGQMEKLRNAASQLDKLWKKGVVPDEDFFQLGSMLETQINKLERNKKALTEEGRAALEESKNKERAYLEGQKFIASLQAQADAAGKTQSELIAMKAAQLGVSEQAAPFVAQMKAQEKQMKTVGISAGQYSQAMKMLPMQITDVVTSLASGMPIWMVAIQQGGQIKDSFGGVANTFKVLMGYITPFNVALTGLIGGIGLLAFNAYKAESELKKIRTTIQDTTGLTGEFANKIAIGVRELADSSGKSAEEIAKAYITTKDSAQDAIEKLVNVGYTYDEAREKVNLYKDASSFVSLNKDIADHQVKVEGLADSWLDLVKKKMMYTNSASPTGGILDKELGHINKGLLFAKQTQEDMAKVIKESNIEFAKRANEIDKQNLSLNRVRAAQEALNKALEDQKYVAASSNEELKKQAAENVAIRRKELEEVQKLEQKKGQAKKTGGGIVRSPTEQLDRELYTLKAQLETLKEHREVNDVISSQRKTYWTTLKQIQILEDVQSRRKLSAGEQQLLLEQKQVLEMAKEKAELGDQILLQERKNKLEQDSAAQAKEYDAVLATMALRRKGYTEDQIQLELDLQRIQNEYVAKGGAETDQQLQELKDKRRKIFEEETALQLDWFAGMKDAWARYGQEVNDVNGNIEKIGISALNGISDQMAEFLTTGKSNFKDFATSIIKMIVQMITKMAIFNAISSFGFGGGETWTIGSLLKGAGFANGGYTGDGGKYEPKGVVHAGEFVFTKEATQRIGARNLYKLMRGYANGGSVGGSGFSRGASSTSGAAIAFGDINVDVNNGNDPKGLETGVKMLVNEIMTRECSQGGRIYDFVMEKRG